MASAMQENHAPAIRNGSALGDWFNTNYTESRLVCQ